MIYSSSIFSGVRFFLAGFNPQQHLEVKAKLVSEGGVYREEYTPDCTHVIVDNIVYDDPICVAARKDGKALVTSLWINHSFDSGGPADHNLTLYRPPKGLNGIPGANKLLISLTGFHGQERDDIRAMAQQMGALFSKAMVAHKVTHLVCYKFEGEKYILAKRIGSTKIVNQYWLEDCLKAWRLLPEEDYSKSTFEVDMEAEIKDSEDEAEGVTGRRKSGVTNLQTKIGESHNNSVLQNKVSIPATQQGFSINSSINAEGLTESVNASKLDKQSDMMTESITANKLNRQSDMLNESINANTLDKQPSWDYKDPAQMDTKTVSMEAQNVQSHQIENGLPSTSRNGKSSIDLSAKPSLDYSRTTMKTSPLSSRKTPAPKTSLTPADKYGKSDGTPREALAEKIVDGVPTFNFETDTEEAASEGIGGSSIERQAKSSAGKHSPVNSKESPRRFSLSLQSTGELTCQNRSEELHLPEKVIADVCTFTTGLDQGKAALETGTSNAEFDVDLKDPGGILPKKRTAVSNVSHSTPKSQKLASSASKRVDAEEPKTRDNNSLKKRKSGAKSGSRIEDESTGPSPYLSSAKSNANNAPPSRSLPFDVLQGSKPANIDPLTSPKTNNGFPSLADDNNTVQLQNLQKNGADSVGINDLEAEKPGSPKLNSVGLNGNSVSKQPRKKMVARKTLGSRPKASNRKGDALGSSISRSSNSDGLDINSVGQENRKERAASPVADKVLSSHTVAEPGSLGAKPHLNSTTKINHTANPFVDETDAQPKSDIGNDKPQEVEQLRLAKSQTGEASSELFRQTDEAKVTTSAPKKTYKQEAPVAETAVKQQNLVTQKKGKGVKASKKNLVAAKEAAKDADKGEGGKNSDDTVKEPVVSVALKKSRGTLLNKSKRSVEVKNGNELVCNASVEVGKGEDPVLNDQNAKKGLKCSAKSPLNKKHGAPLVYRSEGPVEAENGPVFDGDKGQSCDRKSSEELVASSNTTQGKEEGKNESKTDPGDGNDQVSKTAKCPQKLAGKKRRGTVLLKKSDDPDEVGMENERATRGEVGKLAGESSISYRPVGDDKENGLLLGKGTNKDGKRAGNLTGKKRRGTLVLNTTEAPVDEEQTKSDEDQCENGMLTEKLTSESNLTANKSDVADSKILDTNQLKEVRKQSACFILSGHRLQRKEFQKLIKHLKGKVCRDSHQWSYQASHFIVPDPIRRTEKFFAAAASGSWILKTDYLIDSNQAGKFLAEEPYEWHKSGLNEDGAISLEAPRKWRLLRERTGHGAFYGMRIVIYGECIAPPLETLKRAVNAGDGTILATSPPYTRFLESGIDFAVISPGIPRVDIWVQEFLRHQIPCVLADYLVEFVCKPGYSLDRHVQYNTHELAAKSFSKLLSLSEEVVVDAGTTPDDQVSDDLACQVCGSTDRGDVMLVCGNETGSIGCGIGTHIDCCNPPLEDIPEEDWFCPKCFKSLKKLPGSSKKKQRK